MVLRKCFTSFCGRKEFSKTRGLATLAIVINDGAGVRIERDLKSKEFHPLWLRERTSDPTWIHAASRQRKFEVSEWVDAPESRVIDAQINNNDLVIRYADGFSDILNLEVLLSESESPHILSSESVPVSIALPDRKPWGNRFGHPFDLGTVSHRVPGQEEDVYQFLESLFTWGVAIVKDTPRDIRDYEDFLRTFGSIRETNWGKWFEVVAHVEPESDAVKGGKSMADAAYTNLGIPLHTDGPYNLRALEFQLLHVLKQSSSGGESSLADGNAAALALKEDDPEAFELLCSTSVGFRYADKAHELFAERRMINLNHDGSIGDIFFSGRLDATPFQSLEETAKFLCAKRKFIKHLYDPDCYATFKLAQGDLLIFDNRRVLHGRSEFSAEPGELRESSEETNESVIRDIDGKEIRNASRYLRGCYMEDLESSFRMLKRKQQLRKQDKRNFGTFACLKDATRVDIEEMNTLYSEATSGDKLANRALELLKMLNSVDAQAHHRMQIEDAKLGAQIDLMEHGLQTATRCHRDGCEEEVVVAALLHDVGELVGPSNHGEFAAAMLRPFVSPKVSWMLEHHEVFQMFYYAHKSMPPGNQNIRDVYKDETDPFIREAWDFTADFCEKYDQAAFDPHYESYSLEVFEPMVRKVFSREPYWHTPDHPKKGTVTG